MHEEFFDFLDRLEIRANSGEEQSTRVLAYVVAALADLAALPGRQRWRLLVSSGFGSLAGIRCGARLTRSTRP